MGIIALVLVHLDETDNIRRDAEFGQKMANALSMLNRRSRSKIKVRSGVMTVMSTDADDTAFVRLAGNTAERLTGEQEAAVEQRLARLRRQNKTKNAVERIAETD
jgi:Fe-S cluster biogenesis protein NfuA